MKSLHLQSPWTIQAVFDRTGRRMLSISDSSVRNHVRRRIAFRRKNVLRLSVQSEPEELTGFQVVIHVHS